MTYAQMLSQIIEESGLSLRVIAKRCSDLNLNITPSYISQLKNGKLPPPTDEVSLTLAKVCSAKNQAYLVFQGYLEKAPPLMREYMLASSTLNKILLETLYKGQGGGMGAEAEQYLKDMDILAAMELSSKFVSTDSPKAASELIKNITLACGGVTKADTEGELSTFYVSDNAMHPFIPAHAVAWVMPTRRDLLKDRDVLAFYPDNRKTPILRRYFYVKEKVILVPDNKAYDTYFFDSADDIDYIGKVVSFKVDL